MIDEIASYGVQSILAGFVRLSPYALNQIQIASGIDLRPFFTKNIKLNKKDWNYSQEEVRAYYDRIQAKCLQNSIQFTTCYIGNGENQFWSEQDLWSNKKDCCNVIGRVKGLDKGATSRDIDWQTRIKYSSVRELEPIDKDRLNVALGEEKPIIITNGKFSIPSLNL